MAIDISVEQLADAIGAATIEGDGSDPSLGGCRRGAHRAASLGPNSSRSLVL
jgi:hypothetical protein